MALVSGCVTESRGSIVKSLTVSVRDSKTWDLVIWENSKSVKYRKSYNLLKNRYFLDRLENATSPLHVQKEIVTSVIKWVIFFCVHGSDFSFPGMNNHISLSYHLDFVPSSRPTFFEAFTILHYLRFLWKTAKYEHRDHLAKNEF